MDDVELRTGLGGEIVSEPFGVRRRWRVIDRRHDVTEIGSEPIRRHDGERTLCSVSDPIEFTTASLLDVARRTQQIVGIVASFRRVDSTRADGRVRAPLQPT
jgi:hypothetical protein